MADEIVRELWRVKDGYDEIIVCVFKEIRIHFPGDVYLINTRFRIGR
jgi:hypothetical protein